MKKIIALLLSLLMLAGLTACSGGGYEPVPSTDEEARVVMTLECEGKSYDVKYELYRALFLSHRDELDGGDRELWSGEGKDELVEKINKMIIDDAAEIFGALHLAESIGFDPYSAEVDGEISEYVRVSIEGNGYDVAGVGSYEKYLEMLKEMNLNYSVSELMIRYSIALKAINEYYAGKHDDALGLVGGKLEVSEEKVREYYFGDECVRVIRVYLTEDGEPSKRAEEIRDEIASMSSAEEIVANTIQYTTAEFDDVIAGVVVGRYAMSDDYDEYTEAAFALRSGETSEVIHITTGTERGCYILYGIDKSEGHFENEKHYESIKASYIDNCIGKLLDTASKRLSESAEPTLSYSTISHGNIEME